MRRRLAFRARFGLGFNSRHFHSIRPSDYLGAHSWQATSTCPRSQRGFCPAESSVPSVVEGLYTFYMCFVYMARNSWNDLYVGITDNPEQRLKYHNEKRGALYTKRESKFKIVFLEKHSTLAQARAREIQIKKWRRDKKEMLVTRYKEGLPTKSQQNT